MKHLLPLLLIGFITGSAFSQNYGNEWINFSQQYYAFNVYQTGIHRIDQSALQTAGIPVGSFSGENIQLFGREKEIPILVEDGADDIFNAGDYILFFAERNDGWLDSLVYTDPTHIANPGYSLYNDTIQYFFTWNNLTTNLRYAIDTDTDFGSYPPASYIWKEIFSSESTSYTEGKREGKASGSIFAPGEGWGHQEVETATGLVYTIGIPSVNLFTGPGAPAAQIHLSTTSDSDASFTGAGNHHLRLGIGPNNLELYNHIFLGYQSAKIDQSIAVSDLSNTQTSLYFEIIADVGAVIDRQVLNYWRLKYPRMPHANNLSFDDFWVDNHPSSIKTRVDLQGLTTANPVVLCSGENPLSLTPVFNGSAWQILIPDNPTTDTPRRIMIGDANTALLVTAFEAVNGNGQFTDFSVLSTEEALLMVYHPVFQTATANYGAYRSSLPGGGYNIVMANVNELYQQYGGGIEKHALALRRFALHAYDLATQKPVGFFLIGKGLSEMANGTRKSAANFARSFIPSFGYPSSDIAITAGLHGTQWEPLIPTGRIASTTNQELQNYLDKVIAYEAAQNQNDPYTSASKDWQKQVLHFVGGTDANQQNLFQSFMSDMEDIIEDSLFAGNVTNYYKTTSNPLDPNIVAGVTEKISNGVSLMTFFGHAATSNNGFEINIDQPSNWDNQGKYPVVIGNSCFNGNMFNPSLISTSEHFVNLPDEGAIAFISSVSVGYDAYLSMYSNRLYAHFSHLDYGGTLGEQMKKTIQVVQNPGSQSVILESTCTQMALHGDPMLRLNWHDKPEIEITAPSVYFLPEDINLTVDSIDVNIILANLGRAVTDSFMVEVIRDFPGTAVDSTYLLTVNQLNYKDTLVLRIPLQPNIGIGQNQFTVSVDLPSFIAEQYDEYNNNKVTTSLFINVDGILPVYPYDFAVVPRDSVTVRASTIDPIAGINTYYFELDTSPYYNSPDLRRFTTTGPGGVKEVHPSQWKNATGNAFPLVCTDSTVYFWRVAVDSSVISWNEFSFQYIPGKEGWGQDHFFQFKKNGFYNIIYDTLNKRRNFNPTELHYLTATVFEGTTTNNAYYIDGAYQEYGVCFAGNPPSLYVAVIDSITLQPWGNRWVNPAGDTLNPTHYFGNANDLSVCRINRVEDYFIFRQDNATEMAAFQNMVTNVVPDGDYLLIYAPIKALYSSWDPSVYTTFQDLGSMIIDGADPEKPFAFFVKKGDPSTVVEVIYPEDTVTTTLLPTPHLYLEAPIYKPEYIGLEKTTLIGPSADWQTVYWKRSSLETPSTDSVRLYLEAYDQSGSLQMTIDTLFTPNDSILQLNNLIPAAQYPYLRLGAYYFDKLSSTPAQVDRLHVLYQPVPEAAIDGTNAYYISPSPDSLHEGQQVAFAVDIRNISDYDMDSLLVHYWIEDAQRVRHNLPYERQDSLTVGETLRDTIHFSTLGYGGLNSLWVEVNPYINGSVFVTDQPEQYHFNNLLQVPLIVDGDDEHPILDVTFNGRHILNGDIIDPESEILVTLKDDNPYLIMNDISDTTLFGIYLTDPSGIQKRIPFMDAMGNTVMQWIPADVQSKKFKIIYPAAFQQDGVYTLFVQGTDRSGNISGDIEYRINFEVVRESSITYMMNYPNPFSTSTRFVFTLTGTEEPEDMIIQIMTVTGRVVREITEAEIGPITIGRNISAYAWNGTDEFGDPLANGVYLYRVKAKINGEDIKHRESGADSHFKKEFGKMYLMR